VSEFSLSISGSTLFLILGIILFVLFSVYVYKYTLPKLETQAKTLFILIRSLILALIIFLLFDPVLSIINHTPDNPINYVFIDNSRSISLKDSLKRISLINELRNKLNDYNLPFKFFSFGGINKELGKDDKIAFIEPVTNFENIFDYLDSAKGNIATTTIISDGIITEGSSPLYRSEKSNFPIITVGVGDTSKQKDIYVSNVNYNKFIYAGTPTTIQADIINNGFVDKNSTAYLYEENRLIDSKEINFSETSLNQIQFNYLPITSGEKKLSIYVKNLPEEVTEKNNRYNFYLDIMKEKIRVTVIAGAPSTDVTFVLNSLSADENIILNKFINVADNKVLEEKNLFTQDSTDLFFVIGYPVIKSNNELDNLITNYLVTKNKPFFMILNSSTDIGRLRAFEKILPISIKSSSNSVLEVQPDVQINNVGLLFSDLADNTVWDKLPPINRLNGVFNLKPESILLANSKIRGVPTNTPLIVAKSFGAQRSMIVLAQDIWKWKLQFPDDKSNFFDRFIISSTKWLIKNDKQKNFIIRTSKKSYSTGEPIEIFAELYDQSFNPISDAEIKINISKKNFGKELILTPIQNGIYKTITDILEAGDFIINGVASINNRSIKSGPVKFNIGDMEIEAIESRMNINLLSNLAINSGGKFFPIEEQNKIIDEIIELQKEENKDNVSIDEYLLWSNYWILSIIILLFTVEWFYRKRFGML